MLVSLRLYKLPIMVGNYTDSWQRLYCEYNHCAVQLDDIIIHCFDDYEIARWMYTKVDNKIFQCPKVVHPIGNTDICIRDIHKICQDFKKPSNYDLATRHLWAYTYGWYPKRNDCVHKCSILLNFIFGITISSP